MNPSYTEKVIWDLSVELAFECFSACQNFPRAQENHVAHRLKDAAAAVASNVRSGLKAPGDHRPWFETAMWFMKDLRTQLKIADCLGFMDSDGVMELTDIMDSVRRLMVK